MKTRRVRTLILVVPAILLWALIQPAHGNGEREASGPASEHGRFTGGLLPVFYVSDVLESAEFYRAVGFEFHHFFDYSAGERVKEWGRSEPPIWAEMAAGSQTFGLHRVAEGKRLVVGGTRHYFLVEDVDAHHRRVKASGIEPGELIDKPWMKMFSVTDPDGHEIYFGTEK